jgi:hypothetical protein
MALPTALVLRGRIYEIGKFGWLYCREHNCMFNVFGENYCHCLPKNSSALHFAEVGAAFDKAQAETRSNEEEMQRLKAIWP